MDQDNCEQQACVVDYQLDPMCVCENGLGGSACSRSPCGVGLVPFGVDQACVAPQPRISAPDSLSVPMDASVGYRVAVLNASVFPPSELGLVTFSIAGWEAVALGADRSSSGDVGGDTGGSSTSPIAVTLADASTPTPGVTQAFLLVAAAPVLQNGSALLISLRATFSYRGVSNTTTVILRISVVDPADSGGGGGGGGSSGGNSDRSSSKDKDESGGIPGYFVAFITLAAIILVGVVLFCCCARTSGGSDEQPDKSSVVFDNPSFAGRPPPVTVQSASGHGARKSRPSKQNPTYAAATPPVAYDHASREATTLITGAAGNASLTPGGSPAAGTAVYDTASPTVFRPAAGTAVYDTASHRSIRSVQPPAVLYDMASGSTGKGDLGGDGDDGYLEVEGAILNRAVQFPVVYDKAVNRVPTYDRATAGASRSVLRAATATYDVAIRTQVALGDATVHDQARTPVSSRSSQKSGIRRGERDGSFYEGFTEDTAASTEA